MLFFHVESGCHEWVYLSSYLSVNCQATKLGFVLKINIHFGISWPT